MTKRKKRSWSLAVVLAVSAYSALALAQSPHLASAGWGPWDRIERVYVGSTHLNVVMTTVSFEGGSELCDQGRQFYVDQASPNYDVMSRALLTAFAGRNEVKLYWDGTSIDAACRGRINRFQVR